MKRKNYHNQNRDVNHNYSSNISFHFLFISVTVLDISFFTVAVEISRYRIGPFIYSTT